MKSLKKFTAAVLSALVSFSAVNALPERADSYKSGFSYKVVSYKDAILTEIKPSKQRRLSDPIEGRYNIIEVADNASQAEAVPEYYDRGDVASFWLMAGGLMCSPLFMFSGFLFDNPNNVPKVGKFKGDKYVYSGITSVDLPYCKRVGKNAFLNCQKIKTVNLPQCTVLEEGSLTCCNGVTKLNVPECLVLNNPFGIDTKYEIWYDAQKSLMELNAQKCTKIEDRCFGGFTNLKKANIPNVTTVGKESFALCRSLSDVSLDSCTDIKDSAFKRCISLKNIYLPNCKRVGFKAFEDCRNIINFIAPKVTAIGANAFANTSGNSQALWIWANKLEEVYIPSCTYIGANAFKDCKKLKRITVSRDCKFADNSLPFERVSSNKLEIVRA